MSEEQSGSLNIRLPGPIFLQPGLVESFLIVATDYLAALDVIAASKAPVYLAANSLGAQSLECMLKAVLARAGYTKIALGARGVSHNLVELWQKAAKHLRLDPDPPGWVIVLHQGHGGPPYHFRYHEEIHGLSAIPAQQLCGELAAIRKSVDMYLASATQA